MLSRVAACWLVVLVLAPFTAPFPTCDLVTLVGGAGTQHLPAHVPASSIANDSIVASVPAIGAGRVRLSVCSGAFASAGESFPASTTVTRAAAPAGRIRDHAGLAAILRV